MSSNLPKRPDRPTVHEGVHERAGRATFVYEVRAERKIGGIAGVVLGLLLFAALVAFLVIGAITFTLVLWLACAAVVVGGAAAFVRRVFKGPPGPPSH